MYAKSARFYDAIYGFKDYAHEAEQICDIVWSKRHSDEGTLLDVACGTGRHLQHLSKHFTCEGVELEPEMAAIARQRVPEVLIHQGDMRTFDLGKTFDVVTCLFGSIGYTASIAGLKIAVSRLAKHLSPRGVMIVEPWIYPETYNEGSIHSQFVDLPDLKIARMVKSERRGDVSVMDMHHMVLTPEAGVQSFVEHHELMMFSADQYREAFVAAKLNVEIEAHGLMEGRGLIVATH